MAKNELFASVVIVAAGKGTRMNMDVNKQYLEILDKPVLARTIQPFEDCDEINEIILVVNSHDILFCKQEIVDRYGFTKVKSIVSGGSRRQDSVFNGLKDVNPGCDVVLIHDGARPFVSENLIVQCIHGAYESGAVCAGVPVKDTIKTADGQGYITGTLDRSLLWATQTPQSFRLSLIMEAHCMAGKDDFEGTDDAVLVERLGHKVKFVMGSYDNIKITTREDLPVAEAIAAGYN